MPVSALIATAKSAVERALPLCWVSGEISGFKRATSGHCYFVLKDEAAQAPCVLYRHKSARVPMQLRDGLAVELRVLATFYAPRGEFQLQVEEARLAGIGALYEAFLRVKTKLAAEGLFDESRKRALPKFPRTVGLITSASGAVLHDMVRTLRARWPAIRVVLYPSVVQGESAPTSLVAALQKANARKDADVLIIGRGGGSMEDLWAFNDEALAREIANSALPIVSAVGHETDFTIADFVADVRAPTPTYAATLVVPDAREWAQRVDGAFVALGQTLFHLLDRQSQRLETLAARLKHPGERLRLKQSQLHSLGLRLQRTRRDLAPANALHALGARLRASAYDIHARQENLGRTFARVQQKTREHFARSEDRLRLNAQALAHLSPQRVLERGYAFVQAQDGRVISSVNTVQMGDGIRLTLADGELLSSVEKVSPRKPG